MAASSGSDRRRVLPRWRSAAAAATRGELSNLRPASAAWAAGVGEELDDKEREWHETHDAAVAGELVTLAFLGNDPSRGLQAAETTLPSISSAWPLLQDLFRAPWLTSTTPMASPPAPPSVRDSRIDAARVRSRITADPRNAIAWTDMARVYSLLGQSKRAERATRVAMALAPLNRFVLRSAARLYVHQGDLERAHRAVVSAAHLSADPWLIATELAIADLANWTPRCGRQGRSALEAGRYRDRDVTELASALATLELGHGRTREARRLFRLALREPNDNALAQAEWAERSVGELGTRDLLQSDTSSYEAQTRLYRRLGKWSRAVAGAISWQGDEPYSEVAAAWSSSLVSVADENYRYAAHLSRQGLVANPGSGLLRNNLAYSLIECGDLEDAERILCGLPDSMEDHTAVASRATRGLLAFRRGNLDEGRRQYDEAIRQARSVGLREEEAMAAVMLAREEVRSGGVFGVAALDAASQAVKASGNGLSRLALDRILSGPPTAHIG